MNIQNFLTKHCIRGLLIIYLFIGCAFISIAQSGSNSAQLRTVVIDAGHGGKDPGTIGKNVFEKNVVLPVALKLGALIKERHPQVSVVYTRDKDVFIELSERANIANKHKADLFISIHANSLPGKNASANGSETFVMGLDKSGANMEVAKRENAAIIYEDDYKTKYEGYDPNSPESFIIFSLMQNAYLEQSLAFASLVQEELPRTPIKNNRGVKQERFLVLWRTAMPSVLVELGFLSNPDDEKQLMSPKGQDALALAIANAFDNYKEYHERNVTAYTKYGETGSNKASTTTTELKAEPKQQPVTVKEETKQENKPSSTPPKQQTPVVEKTKDKGTLKEEAKEVRYYRVQIIAASKRQSLKNIDAKQYGEVREIVENNLYKITVGNFTSHDEASELCKKLQKTYPGAFVVCFLNGKKVPLN